MPPRSLEWARMMPRKPGVVLSRAYSDGDSPAGVAVRRNRTPRPDATTELSSHDDIAYVKRNQTDHAIEPPARGWTSIDRSATRRRRLGRRLGSVLLLLPLVVGILGAPATTPTARGDELADAKARQERLKKEIADQKDAVALLTSLQNGLADEIRQTANELKGINADLVVVKKKITGMESQIATVKSKYESLVTELKGLDGQLTVVEAIELAKRTDLSNRKTVLADRVRSAYDTDRTSMLESFLSGGSFTDIVAEMSYFMDVGEQDKALADQIVHDQETLASLHATVDETRTRTNDLRLETEAQKRALDKSLSELKSAKAQLKKLEKRTAQALAAQKSAYSAVLHNKAAARRALAKAAAAAGRLQSQISEIIREQSSRGNIPSAYNGTLAWPMGGDVTQNFGCTGFSWEPPLGSCSHFHRGIDIVAPYGTPVKASGDGTVVYIGWNYADGPDPAWIVIVAHSEGLQTWYAHMSPTHPGGISQGSHVEKGQIVGYEGNTGHSTGAHLHWAVMLNGDFVNPRLFL
jgi:murein DD-endopeptidase MepM/ murein hydrolase activator NlpD